MRRIMFRRVSKGPVEEWKTAEDVEAGAAVAQLASIGYWYEAGKRVTPPAEVFDVKVKVKDKI